MNKDILEYRQSHPKCKWCKWYHFYSKMIGGAQFMEYDECILKDKIIHFIHMPTFCKYYQVKEDNNEKDKNDK